MLNMFIKQRGVAYYLLLMVLQVQIVYSVYSHILDEREELTNVQLIATGDIDPDNVTTADLKYMSLKDLENAKIKKLNELKCSYLMNAHFHFSIVREMHKMSKPSSSENADIYTISFEEEAVNMVRTFFGVKGMQMYEVWLVYDLVWKMANFEYTYVPFLIRSLKANEQRIVKMHDIVIEELEKYFESNCDSRNFFYIKSNICMHYKDYGTNVKTDLPGSLNFIKETSLVLQINNCLWNRLVTDNSFKCKSLKKGNEKITRMYLSNLLHNEYDITDCLVETWCRKYVGRDAWKEIRTSLVGTRFVHQVNEINVKVNFGWHYHTGIDVLKLVMLRIWWTYLDTVNIGQLNTTIDTFVSALDLKEDDFFGNIVETIKSDHYEMTKKAIENEHNAIATSLNLSPIQLTELRDTLTEEIVNEFLQDVASTFKDSYGYSIFKSHMKYKDENTAKLHRFLRADRPSDKGTLTVVF